MSIEQYLSLLDTSIQIINHFTGVDKPDEPTIISISETTIHVVIPITWKDEYDKISIHYSFDIRVTF